MLSARFLIEHGADTNFEQRDLKLTPLHWASFHRDYALAALILNHEDFTIKPRETMGVDIAGIKECKSVLEVFLIYAQKQVE